MQASSTAATVVVVSMNLLSSGRWRTNRQRTTTGGHHGLARGRTPYLSDLLQGTDAPWKKKFCVLYMMYHRSLSTIHQYHDYLAQSLTTEETDSLSRLLFKEYNRPE